MAIKINDFAVLDFIINVLRHPHISIASVFEEDTLVAFEVEYFKEGEVLAAKKVPVSDIKENPGFNLARAVIEELQTS